jgi:tripartite-type tricarboxylate transporter receptor subunit TctC
VGARGCQEVDSTELQHHHTPKETVFQLAGWFTAAMQVPEVRAKLVAQGLFPAGMCGADFTALIHKQYEEFGRVIREANIKAE